MKNIMEVIVKIGKTNTMTNTWGKTKTKNDKDKKMENKRITVKFTYRLQRHPVTMFYSICLLYQPSTILLFGTEVWMVSLKKHPLRNVRRKENNKKMVSQ